MKKCFLMVLGLMLAGSVQAEIWSLADDFSTAANPNGAWRYGWYRGGTTNFTLYNNPVSGTMDGSTYTDWEGPAGAPWAGFVLKNQGPNVMDDWAYYEPGQVILHPGSDGDQMSTVRWTAPRSMTVDVTALFTGQAPPGTTVTCLVLKNNATQVLVYSPINGFYGTAANNYADRNEQNGPSYVGYSQQLTFNQGENLEFSLYYQNDYGNDSTGLAVTITEVPEPMTMILLAVGGLLIRRKG